MPSSPEPSAAASHAPPDGLKPQVRWSQVTDAPLAGLTLAREAGLICAWDDAHNLYLIDLGGQRVRTTRTPVPLKFCDISDDGSQIIAASSEGDIWWLGKNLEPRLHQGAHRHLLGIGLAPFGEYLAVSLNDNHTYVYDCLGRRVTDVLTHRPLRFLTFLVGQALLIGAAEYGLVGCYELDGTPRWQDALWSSAGHLTASGEGYAMLVSCYGHGLQRYGLDGTNEGAYHLGGGVSRASLDYDGKTFAAATLEGEILYVNAAGHVLWRQMLTRPAREIALDAAAQFIVYGQETGEVTLLDLRPAAGPDRATPSAAAAPAAATPPRVSAPSTHKQLKDPTWTAAVFDSEAQAETAVLHLVDDPPRIAVFSNRKTLEIFDEQSQRIHTSDQIRGVGRYLEADATTILASTDRYLVLYDVATNESFRFERTFVQLSHIRLDGEAAEVVLIEERDLVSRFDLRGNRRWVATIDSAVETLALGPDRTCALTTEDGRLIVLDGDKRVLGEYRAMPRETLAVVRLGQRWITMAGKAQYVRCHRLDGTVEWEVPIPTEAWRLVRLGGRVLARSTSGRLFVFDARGRMVLDSTELPPDAVLFADRSDEPAALFWRAGNIMVTDLAGRVHWRHLTSESQTLGPVAAGAGGVACAIGRNLTYFAT